MDSQKAKREFLEKRLEYFGILTHTQQVILRSHYGLGQQAMTLKEIGATGFDVTRQTIAKVEKRAFLILKKNTPIDL